MHSATTLLDLYHHMEWADAKVREVVLKPEFPSADADLHKRLFHIHFTQLAFLSVWRGDDFKMRKPDEFKSASEIFQAVRPFYSEAKSILTDRSEADLKQPMVVPWAKFFSRQLNREPAVTSLAETMMQVALHTQHHRGQLNTFLRTQGATPPMVDYIGWVWAGRPAAAW